MSWETPSQIAQVPNRLSDHTHRTHTPCVILSAFKQRHEPNEQPKQDKHTFFSPLILYWFIPLISYSSRLLSHTHTHAFICTVPTHTSAITTWNKSSCNPGPLLSICVLLIPLTAGVFVCGCGINHRISAFFLSSWSNAKSRIGRKTHRVTRLW